MLFYLHEYLFGLVVVLFLFYCCIYVQVADEAGLEVSAQLAAVPSATIGESLVGSLHFTNGLLYKVH
jgi:hypothetical protein